MFEEFFPLIYAGVGVTGAVFGLKFYLAYLNNKVKLAAREKLDLNKPETAVDKFVDMVNNAPEMLATAKAELEKIKKNNPGVDLKAQESEIKFYEAFMPYRKFILMGAPFIAPIAKRYVGKISRSL